MAVLRRGSEQCDFDFRKFTQILQETRRIFSPAARRKYQKHSKTGAIVFYLSIDIPRFFAPLLENLHPQGAGKTMGRGFHYKLSYDFLSILRSASREKPQGEKHRDID